VTAQRIIVVATALLAVGILALGVRFFALRDPSFDERVASQKLVAQMDAETPLAADVELAVATNAEPVRKPHPRVELGKRELRVFGDVATTMPDGGTRLGSIDLTSISAWGAFTLREAGVESRTLELAVDVEVRFGVVVDALRAIDAGDLAPRLFLVKNPHGDLAVFKPAYNASFLRVVLDAHGAHAEAIGDRSAPQCTWTSGDATSFVRCLGGPPIGDYTTDAGGDAQGMSLLLQAFGRRQQVTIQPTADVRWGDVIAIVDALAGLEKDFTLGFDLHAPR
jgi:hypothetical protein